MPDILDAIDAVTAPACGWCCAPLRPNGPSGDFCDEWHQWQWASAAASKSLTFGSAVLGIEGLPARVPVSDVRLELAVEWRGPNGDGPLRLVQSLNFVLNRDGR